jgi:hypothetical protein
MTLFNLQNSPEPLSAKMARENTTAFGLPELSRFSNLYVSVSLKGTCEEEFTKLAVAMLQGHSETIPIAPLSGPTTATPDTSSRRMTITISYPYK